MTSGETVFLIIWLVLFVVVFVSVLSFSRSFRKQKHQIWHSIAKKNGLQLIPEGLINRAKIEGIYRNHNVEITTFKRRPVTARFIISVKNPDRLVFSLHKQGVVVSVTKSKQNQIHIDGGRFDRLFFVEGFPTPKVKKILMPQSIQNKLGMMARRGSIKIQVEKQQLRFEQPYPATYKDLDEYFLSVLDLLIDIAEAIDTEISPERASVVS